MPDWNTRLAVSYEASDGTSGEISPIDSFSPSFALNAEVIHSLEATHVGVVYNPQNMTFSMSVKAIGDTAARLTTLALNGTRFNIVLLESEGGADWSFKSVVMSDCVITSASPSSATISGAPAATFSGFSLAAKAEPKLGTTVKIP
jgi:hypothetical protein